MAFPPDGVAGTLFSLNFDINYPRGSTSLKLHLVGADYAAVVPAAEKIATALRRCMPMDSEIFFASVNKDDSKRDSKFVPGCLGDGLFVGLDALVPTVCNQGYDAILVRTENSDGGNVPLKIGPVPDEVIVSGEIAVAMTAVTTTFVGVDPTTSAATDYALQFVELLKLISKYCYHIRTGHAPGGVFTGFAITALYPMRAAKKKGRKHSFV